MHLSADTLKFLGRNPTGDLGPLTAYTSRRHGAVWFTKSPPLKPASEWQRQQRNRFRLAAKAWKELPKDERDLWTLAARRARLYITGYNLWMWWLLCRQRPALATIERQSQITLYRP